MHKCYAIQSYIVLKVHALSLMPRPRSGVVALVCALFLLTSCGGGGGSNGGGTTLPPPSGVLDYITREYDKYQTTVAVYLNSDDSGNVFAARGKFNSPGGEASIPTMEEAYPDDALGSSGINCIHARFLANGNNWGGWYMMNGYLDGTMVSPAVNWGDRSNAGLDLSGANALTFYARGAVGGERVEFFCCGVGWPSDTSSVSMPFKDSLPKISLGFVTLGATWKQYSIPLAGKDLHYVLGGFGWVSSSIQTGGHNIDFYIDQIEFQKSHPADLRLPLSYRTIRSNNDFDTVQRNVAYVYDASVALIAVLANNDKSHGRLIADSLVYAIQNDRFYSDGGIRTGYQAGGKIALNPGWTPHGKIGTARMPGWYDTSKEQWFEDSTQVARNTGNVAWTAIALLSAYRVLGDTKYLTAARGLADWVETNCRDSNGAGGYRAGFEGWETGPQQLTYKSTEHNIDLYCVFTRLFSITGDPVYQLRANYARHFVESMWDDVLGVFYTGTTLDGVTINKSNVPVDIQAWSMMSLRDAATKYQRGLEYAEAHHRVQGGYDFNDDKDGVWPEGTGQVASAYSLIGRKDKAQGIIDFIHSSGLQDMVTKGVYAASKDGLTTGFGLSNGMPWVYYHRLHIGASSWLALAESSLKGTNPFYVGEPSP
jgi:hypothetical protein